MYKESDFIILDEPTSAIDPLEEEKIYDKFLKISKDKKVILITHRLSSIKLADRILVLDDGSIKEEGTHEELMK